MAPITFFFQAEDGIRDGRVTGVQTCALPISSQAGGCLAGPGCLVRSACEAAQGSELFRGARPVGTRSEERRVGKECRARWTPDHLKKNHLDDEVPTVDMMEVKL